MNVKSILVLAASVIIALNSIAQEDKLNKTLPVFSIQTEKDTVLERISYTMESKVERYLSFTDSLDRAKLKNTGYRIQIYSNSGPAAKETAVKQQSEFLKLHEKTPSYTKWSYPNWVVRVGDFRTKLEALEMHLAIRELYPASFIISDEIVVKY